MAQSRLLCSPSKKGSGQELIMSKQAAANISACYCLLSGHRKRTPITTPRTCANGRRKAPATLRASSSSGVTMRWADLVGQGNLGSMHPGLYDADLL